MSVERPTLMQKIDLRETEGELPRALEELLQLKMLFAEAAAAEKIEVLDMTSRVCGWERGGGARSRVWCSRI